VGQRKAEADSPAGKPSFARLRCVRGDKAFRLAHQDLFRTRARVEDRDRRDFSTGRPTKAGGLVAMAVAKL
jgi:hypothetical protein